jgi:hypothetical protein
MKKNQYETPIFEIIELDSEISLALESNPPFGPGEEDPLSFDSSQMLNESTPFI